MSLYLCWAFVCARVLSGISRINLSSARIAQLLIVTATLVVEHLYGQLYGCLAIKKKRHRLTTNDRIRTGTDHGNPTV